MISPAQPVVPGTPGAARATSGAAREFGPFPAYLDTGASATVLDPGVISVLGAEPVAAAGLHVLGRDTVSHHGVDAVEVARGRGSGRARGSLSTPSTAR